MTKQDKIREGIPSLVPKHIKKSEDCGKRGISLKGSGLYLDAEPFMDDVIRFLHSQGVVVRVERELPNIQFIKGNRAFVRAVKEAGYEAVEPLRR